MRKLARALLAAAVTMLFAVPVAADGLQVSRCEWMADMRNIVEPWEKNSRTFYRGEVRAVFVDTIEPGCCSAHFVVLIPDRDDVMGGRKCFAVNLGGGFGFGTLDFQALDAGYDPATGLTLTFPYQVFDAELSGMGPPRRATVRINLSTSTVSAW